ncbi:UDPglucose 6-dehydrogenase [Labedella gwakjiensis]|uniref:UDP-glucose 6-dehydrogenase n=1 Tax=Labedella gwakjiensis TaxID=390269 RepID=A0A2P8GXU3_9MICO|nr:UDP-glucose/GDP-mannose dehydrogenase family protein [Labedella gwakjiensis]PSL38796.1 UDPglucose 6-dehydrogenase [Labedella gwakjiensis]RUQ86731.1 UDP-glucose/GDP-mannose dehydrogenase family protein [Labedella gwakjiensis]
MRLSVIGCGYLGAVHAAAMSSLGHSVVGIDVDESKIEALGRGAAPFFEPGLPELLSQEIATGRLTFSSDIAAAADATVHFVAVGTPQSADGLSADLRFVDAAIDALLPHLTPGDVVVGKSTVPVGTAARLAEKVSATGAVLAWNPEFLREGFAIQDTLTPDRLVYGVAPGDDVAKAALDEVYATPLAGGIPLIVTDYATAELVKVAANAFLATKISFINAMAEVAEVSGADVTSLADAIGHDARIGRRFLNAGVGFGGGCLPKDIRAFQARATELGVGDSVRFLTEVDKINLRRRDRVVDLATELLGGDVTGKRIAVLGLAFKPNSDDIRDSPALDITVRLHEAGAAVVATDPEAVANARRRHPEVGFGTTTEALAGADIVILLTEWSEYRELDPTVVAEATAGRIVIDGRNTLDAARWRAAGWTYRGLGRS